MFALAALAAVYLWRQWFGKGKTGGCGKCGGCDSKPKRDEPQLVQIDLSGSWNGKK